MKKLLTMAAVCLMAAMTFAAQCAATTKKGTQCKREASPGSQYCWQHGGSTKAERGDTQKTPPQGRRVRRSESDENEPVATPRRKARRTETEEAVPAPSADGQCQATTKQGTQCKRKA